MENFAEILKWFYNLSFEKFCSALESATGNYVAPYYGDEHFQNMKSNFIYWFCNLDSETQNNFVQLALNEINAK